MFENELPLEQYIDLRGPCFDSAFKPIYVMKYPAEYDREVMVAAYEELMQATDRIVGPFAMLIDITEIRAGNAEGRKLAASYADRLEAQVGATEQLVGLAVVAAKPWQRGLFTAVSWLRKGKQAYPTKSFASQREAIVWLRDELNLRVRALAWEQRNTA
ncbi:MAG: hypothetical protein AAGF92_11375 [Myxococcota bacterium]